MRIRNTTTGHFIHGTAETGTRVSQNPARAFDQEPPHLAQSSAAQKILAISSVPCLKWGLPVQNRGTYPLGEGRLVLGIKGG